jgi:HAD superfamily hydrolase (TIGR01458 family)
MIDVTNIKALLIDLDGTISFKGKQIPRANETIEKLRTLNIDLRFITNIDSIPVEAIHKKLRSMRFNISLNEIFSPNVAALKFFENHPGSTCYCLVSDKLMPNFLNLNWNYDSPDYVVIGDFEDKLSSKELNKVFNFIMKGAKILALNKGRFYHSPEGMKINTGSFVSLFEYATNQTATILGKPSENFINLAISDMGLTASEVAIVGDDISTDILGAINTGAYGILVKTGEYNESLLMNSNIIPNLIIDSIADLPLLFSESK